jgi:deoxyribonuclease IV
MRFGMHLSFKGGPERARAIGAKALQVFSGNPRGWQKSPLDEEFVRDFRGGLSSCGIEPLVVHATYLINLAANNRATYELSCASFIAELERSAQLGAQFYVIHIGNHGGAGPEEGRKRVAACMQQAVAKVPGAPEILVENTAGGGTTLGRTFEDIAALFDEAKVDRLGLCFDTCHAFAAGYDIRTERGVFETIDTLDRTVGLKRLRCLHINDSKGELGSHLDRHEHLGKGCIGAAGFKAFFGERRLWALPAILETPRDDIQDEIDNLWIAMKLAAEAGALDRADLGGKPAAIDGIPKSFATGKGRGKGAKAKTIRSKKR